MSLKRYGWIATEQEGLKTQVEYLQKKLDERSRQSRQESAGYQENKMFWSCVHRVFEGFPKIEPKMELSGKTPQIGPLHLGQKLGEGSFGKVYVGRNEESGEMEAVKILSKRRIQDLCHVRDIWRETTLLQNLQHPGIVTVCGVLHTPQYICMRLELVGRRNLSKAQKEVGGRFAPDFFWDVGGQVAYALAYLHTRGVAHRDVKHENVVLRDAEEGSGPTIKLIDFGHAVEVRRAFAERQCGTMPFAAPEILRAREPSVVWNPEGDPDPCAVDVWTHGVLLLEMVCGLGAFNRMLGWPMQVEPTSERGAEL